MTLSTVYGLNIDSLSLSKYFDTLVNKIFKILPIIENKETSLGAYVDSLCIEIEGCKEMVSLLQTDPMYISLLSTITWIRNHTNDDACTFKRVRREIFHAISICKKLKTQILDEFNGGESDGNVDNI